MQGPQTPPTGATNQAPRLMIQNQYVKDLSFENPGAPRSLEPGQSRPEIQVRVDVRVDGLAEDRYEVALHLNVEAKHAQGAMFLLELTYAGQFALLNVPPDARQPILLIECPRLIFPFARRIVADATRDGGFPPLMIDPIDFAALYRRRQEQAQQAAAGEALQNPTVGDMPTN